jgi:hypothetical protein
MFSWTDLAGIPFDFILELACQSPGICAPQAAMIEADDPVDLRSAGLEDSKIAVASRREHNFSESALSRVASRFRSAS